MRIAHPQLLWLLVAVPVLVLGYVIDDWEGELTPDSDAMDLRFYRREERPKVPFDAHSELIDLYDELMRA